MGSRGEGSKYNSPRPDHHPRGSRRPNENNDALDFDKIGNGEYGASSSRRETHHRRENRDKEQRDRDSLVGGPGEEIAKLRRIIRSLKDVNTKLLTENKQIRNELQHYQVWPNGYRWCYSGWHRNPVGLAHQ